MEKLSRRDFLKKLGAAGALGALYATDTLTLTSALAQAAGEDYRALVCVFLTGGNDGNSTVVPAFGDDYAAYSAVRQSMVIPAQDLALLAPAIGSATHGLHPQLGPLKDIWDDGAMAVLLNVGTLAEPLTRSTYSSGHARRPDSLFSHYDQQMQWQGTGPTAQLRSGWGGRIADRLSDGDSTTSIPMVISVAGDSLYVTGNLTNGIAIPAAGGFSLSGSTSSAAGFARRAALDKLLAMDRNFLLVKGAGDVMTRALASSEIIDQVITSENTSIIQGLFYGQNNDFAKQLLQVAKLIEARTSLGARRQIFFVSLTGFDTHFAQIGTQSNLFTQLAPALKAFYNATVQLGVASNVTTFTLSDFGRSFQPNTSGGTDHGWGSHHFIIGGAVRGRQFYGKYPMLVLDGPDDAGNTGCWIPTISVDQYAATLATWLGVSASDLPLVVPNIGRFADTNLGFMT